MYTWAEKNKQEVWRDMVYIYIYTYLTMVLNCRVNCVSLLEEGLDELRAQVSRRIHHAHGLWRFMRTISWCHERKRGERCLSREKKKGVLAEGEEEMSSYLKRKLESCEEGASIQRACKREKTGGRWSLERVDGRKCVAWTHWMRIWLERKIDLERCGWKCGMGRQAPNNCVYLCFFRKIMTPLWESLQELLAVSFLSGVSCPFLNAYLLRGTEGSLL